MTRQRVQMDPRGSRASAMRRATRLTRLIWGSAAVLPVAAGLAVQLAAPQSAFAVGEQNGRLRGAVIEKGSQVPLPGAKVTIRSDAMIGQRNAVTDEEGGFDFPSVPHGVYTITVAYEGMRPIKRKARVELGETQNIRIEFSAELAASETTTIVEERKRIDTDKVSTGRVLTAEQQGKIATQRSYQSIVQQLPGVIGTGNPVMAGGSFRHNRYLVDGMDVTDPVTNTFSTNFNFDAIAQVDAQLLAVDAQYNSMGGVINLITKRGSDQFHVDASFYLNHQALSAGARAGSQLYEGKLSDQSDPRPPNAQYQGNINLSGPLIKQKLWFYLATEVRYNLSSVVPGPPLNTQHDARVFLGVYPRIKLTFQPAARHRLELSFNSDPATINNAQQANTFTNEAEYTQKQGGLFGVLNYDWFIRDNLIFGVQAGLSVQRLEISHGNEDYVSSNYFDRASTIRWNAAQASRLQDDQRWRYQFDPTVTWVKKGWLGEHTFKAGAQLSFLNRYRYIATGGNSTYTDDTNQSGDGGALVRDATSIDRPFGCNPLQPTPRAGSLATPCFQATYYDPALVLRQQGFGVGGFIQDLWKPTRWLTIVPGMRIDYGVTKNSQGEVVQNLLGFGPRLGISVDLTRDGKTVVKFAYGRANETLSLLTASSADARQQLSTWQWNRSSGRFDRFVSSSGGKSGYDLRGRCTDGENQGQLLAECGNARLSLTPPRADFVTASIDREVVANVIANVTYTYRMLSFMWDDYELNARFSLDGGAYADYGDERYGSIYAYRPTKEAFRRYHGLDFTIGGNPSPNWSAFIAYTLSWLDGTNDDQITTLRDDSPRDFRLYGYLPDDRRHAVKANGSYTWKGLTLGANLAFFTGGPATRLYLAPNGYVARYGWRGVDPNADPNDIRKWTELRNLDTLTIDVRAQYDILDPFRSRVGNHRLSFIADIFNALDLSVPTGFESNNAATYGAVLNRQTPLRVQLGVRYQY